MYGPVTKVEFWQLDLKLSPKAKRGEVWTAQRIRCPNRPHLMPEFSLSHDQ